MKINFFLPLLSTVILAAASAGPCQGQDRPQIAQNEVSSVVLLASHKRGFCATGFISSDGMLFTNAHVVDLLCPGGDCSSVSIRQSPRTGSPPTTELPVKRIRISQISRALDYSALSVDWGDGLSRKGVFSFTEAKPRRPDSPVVSLGFPRCGVLDASQGIVQREDPLHLFATTKGAHGSSGSPLFYADHSLAGIVSQASSLSGALGSLLAGGDFTTTALRSDLLQATLYASPQEMLSAVTPRILDWYRSHIRTLSGFNRITEAAVFTNAVEGLRSDITSRQTHPEWSFPFLFMGEYPVYLFRVPIDKPLTEFPSALTKQLHALVAAYDIELNGARQNLLLPLPADFSEIRQTSDDGLHTLSDLPIIQDLLLEAVKAGEPGLQLRELKLAIQIVCVIGFLAALWGFSLGPVFSSAPGSILRRTLVTAVCAVALWPLSLVLYWWKKKHRP